MAEIELEVTHPGKIEIPEILPLFTPEDLVIFPGIILPLSVNDESTIGMINDVMQSGGPRIVGAFLRKPTSDGTQKGLPYYRIGTVMMILRMLRMPDNSIRMIVQGVDRIELVELTQQKPYAKGRIKSVKIKARKTVRNEALIRALREDFDQMVEFATGIPDEFKAAVHNIDDPSAFFRVDDDKVVSERVSFSELHSGDPQGDDAVDGFSVLLSSDGKDNGLPGLELGHHPLELIYGGNLLPIDLEDDVSSGQAFAVGLAVLPHLSDEKAFLCFQAVTSGQGRSELPDGEAEVLVGAFCLHSCLSRVELFDRYAKRLLLAVPDNLYVNLFAGLDIGNLEFQDIRILDLFAVDLDDHIVLLETGSIGRTPFFNTADQCAVLILQLEGILVLFSEWSRLNADTNSAPDDAALLLKLSNDFFGQVGGDGESQADAAAGWGKDVARDSDDFALHIDQRSAAVAAVDGGVGLDEILVFRDVPADAELTSFRAYNS